MLAIGRALVASGLSRWYTFVNMDDCFARERLANGSLTGALDDEGGEPHGCG